MRIREIAMNRPRFGYERIHIVLRREGWKVNRKRVHRLYRLEGLQVRMRMRRRKRLSLHRGPAPRPTAVAPRQVIIGSPLHSASLAVVSAFTGRVSSIRSAAA